MSERREVESEVFDIIQFFVSRGYRNHPEFIEYCNSVTYALSLKSLKPLKWLVEVGKFSMERVGNE